EIGMLCNSYHYANGEDTPAFVIKDGTAKITFWHGVARWSVRRCSSQSRFGSVPSCWPTPVLHLKIAHQAGGSRAGEATYIGVSAFAVVVGGLPVILRSTSGVTGVGGSPATLKAFQVLSNMFVVAASIWLYSRRAYQPRVFDGRVIRPDEITRIHKEILSF